MLNEALKNFITTGQLEDGELERLLVLAARGKTSNWREFSTALSGKVIALLFLNASLRTRASFQAGIARLGGDSVVVNMGTEAWALEYADGAVMDGDRVEHVREACKVLSGYFDAVCLRAFAAMKSWDEDRQDTVMESFARHLQVPLISMESAVWHPCQALADALTMREQFNGKTKGRNFVLTWCNHPRQLPMAVPNSAALIAAQLGMNVRIACPEGYSLDSEITAQVRQTCENHGAGFEIMHSQSEAFSGADVIYAKSWTAPEFVGRAEADVEFRKPLKHWMVRGDLMARTNDAIFMHCLPARRNVVVSDEVIDSTRSVISTQAANRVHAQNALLLRMLK